MAQEPGRTGFPNTADLGFALGAQLRRVESDSVLLDQKRLKPPATWIRHRQCFEDQKGRIHGTVKKPKKADATKDPHFLKKVAFKYSSVGIKPKEKLLDRMLSEAGEDAAKKMYFSRARDEWQSESKDSRHYAYDEKKAEERVARFNAERRKDWPEELLNQPAPPEPFKPWKNSRPF
jgi:hypothetical protein